jgi:lipopolysaccharide/colanic/teichoic acid biosynthesis glycosyltransferase
MTVHFNDLTAASVAQASAQAPSVIATPISRHGSYRVLFKRFFDFVFVLAILPVLVPLLAIITLMLWLADGTPFFGQTRLGKDGREFKVLKFRTMVHDAESILEQHLNADPAMRYEWDRTQKLKKDPRITRVGRFLRKTSLDELPQLLNVLRGNMSLVGPRPMMPDQLIMYGPFAASYFSLRPGLTGLWQISERNESNFSRRGELDANYEKNITLMGDVKVMLSTVRVVVRGTGY